MLSSQKDILHVLALEKEKKYLIKFSCKGGFNFHLIKGLFPCTLKFRAFQFILPALQPENYIRLPFIGIMSFNRGAFECILLEPLSDNDNTIRFISVMSFNTWHFIAFYLHRCRIIIIFITVMSFSGQAP